jgi:hypothetical protein
MQDQLRELMESHPRLGSREYAELAIEHGIAAQLDANELLLREMQKEVRRIVRETKSDPQLAFVSISEACDDGTVKEVYLPAQVCTKTEAQRVIDKGIARIEGESRNLKSLVEMWNGPGFGYQLSLPWG